MKRSHIASIIAGSLIVGLGVGLFLDQPGFGMIVGLGIGVLTWAFLALRK